MSEPQAVRRRPQRLRSVTGIQVILLLLATATPLLLGSATWPASHPPFSETTDTIRVESTVLAMQPPMSPLDGSADRSASTITRRPDQPVVRFGGWYRQAGTAYGVSPHLLAALHQVESGASGDSCVANLQGSGAVGPFQFKPKTFQRYAVDGNADGMTDICNAADSLFSAAHYLHSIGADATVDSVVTRVALTRYGTDVERVTDLAQYYALRDGPDTLSASTGPDAREDM